MKNLGIKNLLQLLTQNHKSFFKSFLLCNAEIWSR